jgi:hypothetical protein
MSFQTYSEENGFHNHNALVSALRAAEEDPSVQKISFNASNGDTVRLVKTKFGWVYEDVFGNRGSTVRF